MKIIQILMVLALGIGAAFAGEVEVNLDQVALIAPGQEDVEQSNRIALHFNLPEEVYGSEIIYAELIMSLNFPQADDNSDSVLEIQAYSITTDWSEENADWDGPWTEPGGDIDSLSFYTYTLTMGAGANVFMDVSQFVRSVVEEEVDNFGLMLIPNKYDQPVFEIYSDADDDIGQSGHVRIVYK